MNIFLSWDSKWIGKNIYETLKEKYNIFGVSRTWQNKYDLGKMKDLEKLTEKLESTYFDVIILNAGIGDFEEFENGDLEKYQKIINLNLFANIYLLKKLNYDNKKTKIILIWSIIWKKFMKNASVYQASKFGLRWFAGALKKEWYKVFLINPKIVDTNFHPKDLDLQNFPKTEIKDIVEVVENIIIWKEHRFEIDL